MSKPTMITLPTEEELAKKYPKILQDIHGDPMRTCMAWGLDCGKGWYPLLDKLFGDIEEIVAQEKDTIPGHTLYVRADQIKEKYGTLRFYYTVMLDPYLPPDSENNTLSELYTKISGLVMRAETLSGITCERCGSPGELIRTGWFRCRCNNCKEGPVSS